MIDQMIWPIFGAIFLFIAFLIAALNRYLGNKNRIRQQEMIHKERMAAIEKGIPIPDWDQHMLNGEIHTTAYSESPQQRFQWFRLASLCIGLFLCFGGAGILLGFSITGDEGLNEIVSLGFIPMMAGIGLLLFYRLTKNHYSESDR